LLQGTYRQRSMSEALREAMRTGRRSLLNALMRAGAQNSSRAGQSPGFPPGAQVYQPDQRLLRGVGQPHDGVAHIAMVPALARKQ
jgi:hypothetical protein